MKLKELFESVHQIRFTFLSADDMQFDRLSTNGKTAWYTTGVYTFPIAGFKKLCEAMGLQHAFDYIVRDKAKTIETQQINDEIRTLANQLEIDGIDEFGWTEDEYSTANVEITFREHGVTMVPEEPDDIVYIFYDKNFQ